MSQTLALEEISHRGILESNIQGNLRQHKVESSSFNYSKMLTFNTLGTPHLHSEQIKYQIYPKCDHNSPSARNKKEDMEFYSNKTRAANKEEITRPEIGSGSIISQAREKQQQITKLYNTTLPGDIATPRKRELFIIEKNIKTKPKGLRAPSENNSQNLQNSGLIASSPYMQSIRSIKKLSDNENSRLKNGNNRNDTELRSLHKKVPSQDSPRSLQTNDHILKKRQNSRSDISPSFNQGDLHIPLLEIKESEEILNENDNNIKRAPPVLKKKFKNMAKKEIKERFQADYLKSKFHKESKVEGGTPRYLPPLNLNRVHIKNRTQSVTNSTSQETSNRNLKTESERIINNNCSTSRYKVPNIQITDKIEKNVLGFLDTSFKNFTTNEKTEVTPYGEVSGIIPQSKETESNTIKRFNNQNNFTEVCKINQEADFSNSTQNKSGIKRTYKKISTNEDKIKKKSMNLELQQNFNSLKHGENFSNYQTLLQENSISENQNDLIKTSLKHPKVKNHLELEHLSTEQRYEKIMQSNIGEKFNEIFRSLRMKTKKKRVQFSADVME